MFYYHLIINYLGPAATTKALVITPRSVEIRWDKPSQSCITGYLISYTTNASYTSGGNMTMNGSTTNVTITNLEENTLYNITTQAISNRGISFRSNHYLLVVTLSDGK